MSNSESSRARALIGGNFGDTATIPVLLRGPRAAVKTQGKALATRLAKRPGLRVLSPWTASSGRSALRPSSDRALLLVSVSGTHDEIAARSERVEALVDRATQAPVRSTVTGLPLLTRDGTTSSLAAVHRAELIALPLLLIALLLVFRSPLAAAIPALFGAATIAASTGALALLAAQVRLDAFALAVSCMVGLALAVDYSLLFVSRLREELRDDPHVDVETAVGRAAAPTTRTVAAAAAAIVVAMAVAAAMSPGTALLAAALGVSVVAVLAAASAMLVVPALLVLVGPWLEFGAMPAASGAGVGALVARAASNRPVLGIGAALLLALAAIPALGLQTGAPAAQSLPAGSAARAGYETVSKAMGPGWTEPFEIVAVTRKGAVTTPARLAELARVQRKLSRDPRFVPSSGRARSRAPPPGCATPGAAPSPHRTPCRRRRAAGCAASAAASTPPPAAPTRCTRRCRARPPRPRSSPPGPATCRAASASCAAASTAPAAERASSPPASRTPSAAQAG